jgi:hypothetical protein
MICSFIDWWLRAETRLRASNFEAERVAFSTGGEFSGEEDISPSSQTVLVLDVLYVPY